MKKYNYFYYGVAIPKSQFIAAVPANWQEEIDALGHYSYGGYSADER